jgi:phosphate transport system protein
LVGQHARLEMESVGHYEKNLQRDIDRIRQKVTQMGALVERALRSCLEALRTRNRQLAYSIILRDEQIDELDKEIDRLCLEFILRQQPVAGTLRFAHAAIRINLELERIGDYAESIARHVITLCETPVDVGEQTFVEVADLVIPMLHDAVRSFVVQDGELARKTMEAEDRVDALRFTSSRDLVEQHRQGRLPVEALLALLTIVNRFERAADQAKNICQEVVYMCTGEYTRHQGTDVYRVLFVDEHNACRGQMAEGIGNSLGQPKFIFSSAGLTPEALDQRAVTFLNDKGIDISRHGVRSMEQIPHLDQYQVIVALAPEARKVFPTPPTKVVCFDWSLADPSKVTGSDTEIVAAYESAYTLLRTQIQDLVKAILGDDPPSNERQRP